MNREIVRAEDQKRVLEILRSVIPSLSKVDDQTLITAVAWAKHLGLDPLKREVHFIPYKDKDTGKITVQPIVAYTEYLKRAERSGKLKGWSCQVRREGDEWVAVVKIRRVDWEEEFTWEVPMSEVKRDTALWKERPIFMLKKTAIAQAFRLAFPEETAHLPYEEAESWVEELEEEPEETETEEEKITEAQRKRFFAILRKELGFKDEEIKEILSKEFGIESTADIPKSRYDEIINHFRKLRETQQKALQAFEAFGGEK